MCQHSLSETKVLRDPVHEYIRITDALIWKLIDSKEMQRLRRIHQLGGSYQVYHGAEHSRFSHSLGVYEILRRMIDEVRGLKDVLSEDEKMALKCAALLHDIGHGPFSHSFEHVVKGNHEAMTAQILLGDTDVHHILESYQPGFSKVVVSIIDHSHPRHLLSQCVSAQLDADRMDYLLRDAYYTGVSYGMYDLERILRTLRVDQDSLVVKYSGIHAIEDYIMARYQMYWQVYYHPSTRSFEMMLTKLFLAIKDIYQKDPEFIRHHTPFFEPVVNGHPLSYKDHFILDESTCIYGFHVLATQKMYPVAADLSKAVLYRHLFEYEDYDPKAYDAKKEELLAQGYDPKFYLGSDEPTQPPYIPYQSDKVGAQIFILMPDGTQRELSQESTIVQALSMARLKEDHKYFFRRRTK